METVVMDWVKLGLAASSFILVLKFLTIHLLGKIAPSGFKTTVAAI